MSAFIVSDKHISGMVKSVAYSNRVNYHWNGKLYNIPNDIDELGQKLLDENYRSVNYRYSEVKEPHQFAMQRVERLSAVQIIKLCDCYNYQACETNDYKDSEAKAIMTAIRERAIRKLAGYSEASWELI